MPPILDVNFGREFFGGPEARKFANNNLLEFAEKFPSNLCKIRQSKEKSNPNPLCRTSGSIDCSRDYPYSKGPRVVRANRA